MSYPLGALLLGMQRLDAHAVLEFVHLGGALGHLAIPIERLELRAEHCAVRRVASVRDVEVERGRWRTVTA